MNLLNKFRLQDEIKYAERTVSCSVVEIIENLFQIYLLPNVDGTERDILEEEIYDCFHYVSPLNQDEFPTAKQIYDWTYRKFRFHLSTEVIRQMLEDASIDWVFQYPTLNLHKVSEGFQDFVRCYFSWLSDQLSQFGFVGRNQIHEHLSLLLRRDAATREWRIEL